VLAVEVGGGLGDYLAWFRPETPREVTWGGNPHEATITSGADGARLSPRHSFARWKETVRGTSRPWRPHEVAAARGLAASLTDIAVSRAEENNRLAVALQRTLLLEELPKVPGVALAASYRPSGHDVVGGAWYDLVVLPSGSVAVVIGDVAGHGLSAAAVTAQLRHALRAHLLRDRGPAAALEGLNGLISALLPGDLATALIAEMDPATGEVAVASAGHLPPVQVTAAGAEYVPSGRGPALGLLDDAGYRQTRLHLAHGDQLLMYSDGLVERRRADLEQGLAELRAAAQAGGAGPQALIDAVLAALDPPEADDVTLIAIGRTPA
jgi:chemotaxis family two-component system sensor kinase Cph1